MFVRKDRVSTRIRREAHVIDNFLYSSTVIDLSGVIPNYHSVSPEYTLAVYFICRDEDVSELRIAI